MKIEYMSLVGGVNGKLTLSVPLIAAFLFWKIILLAESMISTWNCSLSPVGRKLSRTGLLPSSWSLCSFTPLLAITPCTICSLDAGCFFRVVPEGVSGFFVGVLFAAAPAEVSVKKRDTVCARASLRRIVPVLLLTE